MFLRAVSSKYVRELHRELQLWPTWPVDLRLELGDIVQIEKGLAITRLRNIRELGIEFEWHASPGASLHYTSGGGVQLELTAEMHPAVINVSFSRRGATALVLADVQIESCANLHQLALDIATVRGQASWDEEWAVVTGIHRAAASAILVSNGRNSAAKLTLPEDASPTLTHALPLATRASLTYSRDLAVQVVGEGILTPLSALYRIPSDGRTVLLATDGTDDLREAPVMQELKPENLPFSW